jgi:hypothetical protein
MIKGAAFDTAVPLLTYELLTVPDPLQAGGPARFKLGVSYGGDDAVTCVSIQLTLPVGDDASDLIDGSAGIETQPPEGWTPTIDGGSVTFTAPDGGVLVEEQGLTFVLATTANAQPGTATVAVTETCSDNGGLVAPRSGSLIVDKFPVDFSLSQLLTVPPDTGNDVPYASPAMLDWLATGDGVSCTLLYHPANGNAQVNVSVPNVAPGGGYASQKLTRANGVAFTLLAQVSVLGRDDPLIVARQLFVTVDSPTLDVGVVPPKVGVNGLVALQWTAANVDHCTLQDGTLLSSSGTAYFVVKEDQTFTVSAFDADGYMLLQQQKTVHVDSSISPNEAGQSLTGATGPNGEDGWEYVLNGQDGDAGGDAVLTIALAPLDATGSTAHVVPISVTGGTGGAGGAGSQWATGASNGGPGGNAVLTATFDATLSPEAQYIVTLTGGAGGSGGQSTLQSNGQIVHGATGGTGAASATIGGQPVRFL